MSLTWDNAQIAVCMAHQLGVDLRPFAVAVLHAASANFAAPIGDQTDTIVYGVGGSRFADFVRIGLSLDALNGLTARFLIPMWRALKCWS
jgi:di/tricarboxylate transporter